MPVAPGEPYGEADVLELVYYGVLLILSVLVVARGLAFILFGRLQLRPFVYRPLHSWVASLAGG